MMMDGYQTELFGSKGSIYGNDGAVTETINPPKMTGWICPVCGRGLSPWTSACPCKGGKGWEVTC